MANSRRLLTDEKIKLCFWKTDLTGEPKLYLLIKNFALVVSVNCASIRLVVFSYNSISGWRKMSVAINVNNTEAAFPGGTRQSESAPLRGKLLLCA